MDRMDLEQKLNNLGREKRSVPLTDVDTTKDGRTFIGYAAVFDHEADLGDFTESISRGAFRRSLTTSGNIPMLLDHNASMPPLATTQGGTLRLKEDGRGLLVEADIANHYVGDAMREMIDRGDIRGMSFGFIAGAGNSRVEQRGGRPHRQLLGFKALLDVSPTWNPAYPSTEAGFRSMWALQMAESLEAAQQVLTGSYRQREDGASIDDTHDEADEAEITVESEVKPDDEDVLADEQRSGADAALAAAAARSRRLQMLGVALPRDF